MRGLRLFLRYAGVGAVGTAAHYCIFLAWLALAPGAAVIASVAGASAGAITTYLLNRSFTFRGNRYLVRTATRFAAVAAFGIAANGVLVSALTQPGRIAPLSAQALATVTILVGGFLLNRSWVFRSARA